MENTYPVKEITLPVEMASDALSLEEIGALFVIMTMPYNEKSEWWGKHEQFLKTVKSLIDEGIVVATNVDGKLDMDIDLTWI